MMTHVNENTAPITPPAPVCFLLAEMSDGAIIEAPGRRCIGVVRGLALQHCSRKTNKLGSNEKQQAGLKSHRVWRAAAPLYLLSKHMLITKHEQDLRGNDRRRCSCFLRGRFVSLCVTLCHFVSLCVALCRVLRL